MADRKQFQETPPANAELLRLLSETKERVVTESELREQRISFAFGNATNPDVTKDSVRKSSQHIRLLA